jgi:Fe-S cluster assembly protein SufD
MSGMREAAVAYGAALTQTAPALAGAAVPWLRERRLRAAERLAQEGFPDIRQERWRHTNVESIFEQRFEPAIGAPAGLRPEDLGGLLLDDPEALRLVFVNGYLVPALSSLEGVPEGVTIAGVARTLEREPQRLEPYLGQDGGVVDGFSLLNAAYSADGAFLHLAAGVRLERPVDLLYLTQGAAAPLAALPHSLILLEAGAQARVSERFLGLDDGPCLTSALTQVQLGEGAHLVHYRSQQEGGRSYHFGRVRALLGTGAHYEGHSLALGARIGRGDIEVAYQGMGASCALNGLSLAHDGQLLDFHTDVEHGVPDCTTRQRFKAILAGRGRGVFGGSIRVQRTGQGSDAHMRSDNLLLSRNAEVDTKPQLEIHADDVKCGHGATVGQLDPTALFYLRSRGIPESQARHLLTQGFAVDLLEAMEEGPQRRWMEAALNTRLEALHA